MIDRHSPTWHHVTKWAYAELSKATERVETLGVGQDETENLRGRIALLRELRELGARPEADLKPRAVEMTNDYGFQAPETD